jgi:hypothetical protein
MIDLTNLEYITSFSSCANLAAARLDWQIWCQEVMNYRKALDNCALSCDKCGTKIIFYQKYYCPRCFKMLNIIPYATPLKINQYRENNETSLFDRRASRKI